MVSFQKFKIINHRLYLEKLIMTRRPQFGRNLTLLAKVLSTFFHVIYLFIKTVICNNK